LGLWHGSPEVLIDAIVPHDPARVKQRVLLPHVHLHLKDDFAELFATEVSIGLWALKPPLLPLQDRSEDATDNLPADCAANASSSALGHGFHDGVSA